MKRCNLLASLALATALIVGSVPARAQAPFGGPAGPAPFSVQIAVDENGHSLFTNTAGFASTLPFAIVPDPGPGGLAATLTYDLLNPPGLVPGDILITEPGGAFGDVVRFNPTSFTGGSGSLVFYSMTPPVDSLADTPSPPQAFYANNLTLPEINGSVIYTPVAGQPGFVAGAGGPVTYVLVSDGVAPEPSTFVQAALALALAGGYGWHRRRRATA
jgi:MYXO-CTERM domain-containing protein